MTAPRLAWAIRNNADGTLRRGTYDSEIAAARHSPGGDCYSVVPVEIREASPEVLAAGRAM